MVRDLNAMVLVIKDMFELTVLYILYTGLPFLNAIYSNCACFVKVKLYQFYSETDVSWADEKEIKKKEKR